MAQGGICDQVGGGFCRYSVDEQWMIPHFEKMLYDNAQLLVLYADACAATGDALFRRVAGETADWVMREMQHRRAVIYSSLDADSEGHEGNFYVWTPDEMRELLTAGSIKSSRRASASAATPNFEGPPGICTLSRSTSPSEAGLSEDEARRARFGAGQLFAARSARVAGARRQDSDLLERLAIKGLAHAGRMLAETTLCESAARASTSCATLWHDGRLLAIKDGRAHLNAYLDDHAFLLGPARAVEARWREPCSRVRALADMLLEHFEDAKTGGFFFTADDHER